MPASVELFKRHLNPVLIETGTYLGEGIKDALSAGFTTIRSVELSDKLFEENVRRFAGQPGVKVFHGSSEEQLWNMIEDIREPITFWLDAHFSGGITVKGSENSPILKELRIIGRHPVNTHTILIDDRRQVGTADFDFVTEEQIQQAIRAINPDYQLSSETGSTAHPMFKDDIIVARVPAAAAKPVILGDPAAEKMEMPVIKQWFADRGDQTLRVDYPLTRESVVLDVGGYEGNWAAQIDECYGCTIHIFEPVAAFAEKIEERFRGRANVRIHRCGLSDQTGQATISINNDSTSVHKAQGTPCVIQLRSAREIFAELELGERGVGREVDLMKINIEGCEYELLPHLIETGLVKRIRNLQVQFHDFVPDAATRMRNIQQDLAKSHNLSWQYRFVWENWCRKM